MGLDYEQKKERIFGKQIVNVFFGTIFFQYTAFYFIIKHIVTTTTISVNFYILKLSFHNK